MKRIIRILSTVSILLNFFRMVSFAQIDSIQQIKPCLINNEQVIDHLAKTLLDPGMMIGVFEKPVLNYHSRHLKSGIQPELEKDYMKYMISSNLIKLSTQTTIKGDFDSVIFIKYPRFVISGGDNASKSNPVFYEGSVWVLLLEKSFNRDRSSKMEWIASLNKENKKLFNETTVFLEAFETYYAFCYKWVNNESMPTSIIMIDQEMISDLSEISNILKLKDTNRKKEALQLMLNNEDFLNGCTGPIVQKILKSISLNQ